MRQVGWAVVLVITIASRTTSEKRLRTATKSVAKANVTATEAFELDGGSEIKRRRLNAGRQGYRRVQRNEKISEDESYENMDEDGHRGKKHHLGIQKIQFPEANERKDSYIVRKNKVFAGKPYQLTARRSKINWSAVKYNPRTESHLDDEKFVKGSLNTSGHEGDLRPTKTRGSVFRQQYADLPSQFSLKEDYSLEEEDVGSPPLHHRAHKKGRVAKNRPHEKIAHGYAVGIKAGYRPYIQAYPKNKTGKLKGHLGKVQTSYPKRQRSGYHAIHGNVVVPDDSTTYARVDDSVPISMSDLHHHQGSSTIGKWDVSHPELETTAGTRPSLKVPLSDSLPTIRSHNIILPVSNKYLHKMAGKPNHAIRMQLILHPVEVSDVSDQRRAGGSDFVLTSDDHYRGQEVEPAIETGRLRVLSSTHGREKGYPVRTHEIYQPVQLNPSPAGGFHPIDDDGMNEWRALNRKSKHLPHKQKRVALPHRGWKRSGFSFTGKGKNLPDSDVHGQPKVSSNKFGKLDVYYPKGEKSGFPLQPQTIKKFEKTGRSGKGRTGGRGGSDHDVSNVGSSFIHRLMKWAN